MNKSVQRRIHRFIEEELKNPVDQELLDTLHQIVLEDTMYWEQAPQQRNALNKFFAELNDEFMRAALGSGEYGVQVVLQSMIVTAFEVGYKLRELSETPNAVPQTPPAGPK